MGRDKDGNMQKDEREDIYWGKKDGDEDIDGQEEEENESEEWTKEWRRRDKRFKERCSEVLEITKSENHYQRQRLVLCDAGK